MYDSRRKEVLIRLIIIAIIDNADQQEEATNIIVFTADGECGIYIPLLS